LLLEIRAAATGEDIKGEGAEEVRRFYTEGTAERLRKI
jgi:predicted ribonuclease toxin of YeeF-YezG toxin-antitoxin module